MSTTANIETMVLIRHPNNDILPRRTDATSPKNPLNTLFSKYRIKPITKIITNHSGTPSTIIFHLLNIKLNTYYHFHEETFEANHLRTNSSPKDLNPIPLYQVSIFSNNSLSSIPKLIAASL